MKSHLQLCPDLSMPVRMHVDGSSIATTTNDLDLLFGYAAYSAEERKKVVHLKVADDAVYVCLHEVLPALTPAPTPPGLTTRMADLMEDLLNTQRDGITRAKNARTWAQEPRKVREFFEDYLTGRCRRRKR